VQAGKIQPQ